MECYAKIITLRLYFKVRNDVNVYRLLQRWLKKAWIRNSALPGMPWWVKDMVLNSHMKSRIFSTCILEGLLQFVCGNAHEMTNFAWRFICCWQKKTNIKIDIACLEGKTEIVTVMTMSSSTKQGESDSMFLICWR